MTGGGGALKAATAVVGLLAGIVAAVYVLGGLAIALRLFFDHFHQDEVVSAVAQLPRETVIATALLNVVGLAALVGLFAAVGYGLLGRPRPRRGRAASDAAEDDPHRLTSGPTLRVAALFAGLVVVAAVAPLPALVHAVGQEETSRGLWIYLPAVVATYGVLAGAWYLLRQVAHCDWSRGEKALGAGAVWAAVAVVPLLMFAGTRPFVAAQICTVGGELPVKGKLVGESSSSVFLEEEFGAEAAILTVPAGRVTRSEYGDLSSTFSCPLSPGQEARAEKAEDRLGGHGEPKEVALATRLRPRILFDSHERWRPVEVGAFLGERFGDGGGQRLCGRRCGSGRGAGIERLHPGRGAPGYLDVHGGAENGTDYVSASPDCRARAPAVDCNSGPRAVVYYRRTTHEGLWYWDYWWFLRYNDYAGPLDKCNAFNCSDHEGDWEGITVITTPSAEPTIVGAIYAAHRNRIRADAGMVPLSGGRPLVFVAAGTHGSYPYRCSVHCRQYAKLGGTVRLPEGSHDGAAPWGGNAEEDCEKHTCVRALPEVEAADDLALPLAGSWAGWPGHWGATCHRGCRFPLLQGSPRSPGLQIRFECPWAVTDRALPAPDGSGLSRSEPVGDTERLFAACRAQRGGERGLWTSEQTTRAGSR